MEPIFVYVATPDLALARKLGRALVDQRIAACANIVPGMEAIYRWKGRVEEANETMLFMKTTRDRFKELTEYVVLNHPYELPCIVAMPFVEGEQTYLNWVVESCDPNGN